MIKQIVISHMIFTPLPLSLPLSLHSLEHDVLYGRPASGSLATMKELFCRKEVSQSRALPESLNKIDERCKRMS